MIGDMYKNIPAATEDKRNCSRWLGFGFRTGLFEQLV
jgi:hypothetical protein